MAGRALQRQLQKEGALVPAEEGSDDDVVEEQVAGSQAAATRRMNAMALLMGMDSEDEEEEQEQEQEQEKVVDHERGMDKSRLGDGVAEMVGKKKRKNKKNKKKKRNKPEGQSVAVEGSGSLGEASAADVASLDQAIREVQEAFDELGADGKPLQQPDLVGGLKAGVATPDLRPLLGVEKRYLNPEAEMRRMFGPDAARDLTGAVGHGGGGGGRRGGGSGRGSQLYRKTILATPRDTWPRFTRMGLSMTQTETANTFALVHSKEYQKVQMKFLLAVQTLDPANISGLLAAHPAHIDSLLQLSEVMKMNGDLQTAADFVERTLFCFEQAFHPSFNIATGQCRLEYSIYPNRAMFIALFRHLVYVGNRGCWRTAFEMSKLLLALAPSEDPLSALLLIDFYALRAGESSWLTRLSAEWEAERNLSWLPNMAYSTAFALYQQSLILKADGDNCTAATVAADADAALVQAITRFPAVVLLLARKNGATMKPEVETDELLTIADVPLGSSEATVRLLEVLYTERVHTLWKAPAVLDWLQQGALTACELGRRGDPKIIEARERRRTHYAGIPRNVLRHVFMSDYDEVMRVLPNTDEVKAGLVAHDPFPPIDVKTEYDELAEQQRSAQPHGVSAAEMFLRSLIPGFEERIAHFAAQQGVGGGQDGGQGVRARLADMLEEFGVENLLAMITGEAEDDGGPAAQVPEEYADID